MSYVRVSGWWRSFFHGRKQTCLSRHNSSMKMSSVPNTECRPFNCLTYLIQQTDHKWAGRAASAKCNRKTDYNWTGCAASAKCNRKTDYNWTGWVASAKCNRKTDHNWTGCAASAKCNRKTDHNWPGRASSAKCGRKTGMTRQRPCHPQE
ncbi:hypothetical protein J2Z70_004191 [Paenibacillus silagei]|uniref:Uncharacterized protein n=1 Tax=Paenibacillus silagei TaxID=1670801 RepID=A0ABS4NVD6_9BACL|nr:hypothetical protein [Paenibacillus silagei]